MLLVAYGSPRAAAAALLQRNAIVDWGDLGHEDRRDSNDLVCGVARLLSTYTLLTYAGAQSQHRFWIITEADLSATIMLSLTNTKANRDWHRHTHTPAPTDTLASLKRALIASYSNSTGGDICTS